jgi:hypothetical protein
MLDPPKVFVSVYESASGDSTPAWMGIMGGMLNMMGIEHHVVSNSTDRKVSLNPRWKRSPGGRNGGEATKMAVHSAGSMMGVPAHIRHLP